MCGRRVTPDTMAALKAEDAAQVEAVLAGLQAQVTALPEEGRLKLFRDLVREYCTACGVRQASRDFCTCAKIPR